MQNSKIVLYGVLAGITMMLSWTLLNDFLDVLNILSHQ